MLLAVSEACDDSCRGNTLTLPTLVGWTAILRDPVAAYRPEELGQKFVRQGGFIAPRFWDAAVV
eukprot:8521743-Pyramimonas_sp.AAC.1